MTVRPILIVPDRRLRKVAKPVENFDDCLQSLVADLADTMYDADGLGLAAPQIGVLLRVAVIDCDREGERNEALALINPEIINRDEAEETAQEGCLSIPDVFGEVARSVALEVRYQDAAGNPATARFEGIEARCVAHEIDHLDGRLFIDYLGPVKRRMITNRLRKLHHTNRPEPHR